jgi:uncharacterized protein YaiI (UPF0178 family)
VSNLSKLPDNLLPAYRQVFSAEVRVLKERAVRSWTVCNNAFFERLGMADAAIMEVVNKKMLVITDDLRLADALWKAGIDCINWNHIRFLSE